MSKIKTIKVENLGAVSNMSADFNGCTAIITGGNRKGKSTFLQGVADRIRFDRPNEKVKRGEKEGSGTLILTTGEKFEWFFDVEGKDKLIYTSAKGIKNSVTKEIGEKFFPAVFDVDEFLNLGGQKQTEYLQKRVGLDFTDVDARYKKAYDDRTQKNLDAEKYHVKLTKILQEEIPEVKPVDLTGLQTKKEAERKSLNELYLENKKHNDALRKVWNEEKDRVNDECVAHNEKQTENRLIYNDCFDAANTLKKNGLEFFTELSDFLNEKSKAILEPKISTSLYPKEPEYIAPEKPTEEILDKIDDEILAASETNTKAKAYQDYLTLKSETEAAKVLATEADELVKSILVEREKMIASANFPKGIEIKDNKITLNGFPFSDEYISLSEKYIAALQIGSMNLGEVRTLYFDASTLDKNSLLEIEVWANENDLQLLIERPDFEGGEIKYELIQEIEKATV